MFYKGHNASKGTYANYPKNWIVAAVAGKADTTATGRNGEKGKWGKGGNSLWGWASENIDSRKKE
jgi:hypothetical protein